MSSLMSIACASALLLVSADGQSSRIPHLKFEKYTLPNGLEVILHEDHSTPIVGVNVWYHVGSKNERPGRTGFAHLFEHMMFQGSKHYDSDYFAPAAKGRRPAQRLDQPGPHELLGDGALELPGIGAVDGVGPDGLPAARDDPGEARQPARRGQERAAPELREPALRPGLRDAPGGDVPAGPSLQLADDRLDGRHRTPPSREDVADFFRRYYHPGNASLCIAGDFDPAEAKRLVAKYFGPIPAGPKVEKLEAPSRRS